MNDGVVESLKNAKQMARQQYEAFVEQRLVNDETPLKVPIKKNNLQIFNSKTKKIPSKPSVISLKDDRSLFARLYISCQSRDGNVAELFKHENQACPPALL